VTHRQLPRLRRSECPASNGHTVEGDTGDHRTLADSHRAIVHRRSPVLFAALAALCIICSGCGHSSPGRGISASAIQSELSLVVHQRLLHQGFDYHAKVTCDPAGVPFTFSCDILVTNPPPKHHVEWTEAVVCQAKPTTDGLPRCSSSSGESLQ
jgi:hypothetical protein